MKFDLTGSLLCYHCDQVTSRDNQIWRKGLFWPTVSGISGHYDWGRCHYRSVRYSITSWHPGKRQKSSHKSEMDLTCNLPPVTYFCQIDLTSQLLHSLPKQQGTKSSNLSTYRGTSHISHKHLSSSIERGDSRQHGRQRN